MKRQYLCILFIIFFSSDCSSQIKQAILKNIDYYTVIPNNGIGEFKMTQDSLFIIWEKRGDTTIQSYKISYEEHRNKYFIVYLKKKIVNRPKWVKSPHVFFNAIVLYFSEQENRLHVLQEGLLSYPSIEQTKTAYANIDFTTKYFSTWYSDSLFKIFMKYPSINDADKNTMQKVVNEWIAYLKQNSNKVRNTKQFDMYGVGTGQNYLSKVLIKNHLNPNETFTDFDKKTKEYHIAIPRLRQSNNNENRLDTTGRKAPKVIIGPVQQH